MISHHHYCLFQYELVRIIVFVFKPEPAFFPPPMMSPIPPYAFMPYRQGGVSVQFFLTGTNLFNSITDITILRTGNEEFYSAFQ